MSSTMSNLRFEIMPSSEIKMKSAPHRGEASRARRDFETQYNKKRFSGPVGPAPDFCVTLRFQISPFAGFQEDL